MDKAGWQGPTPAQVSALRIYVLKIYRPPFLSTPLQESSSLSSSLRGTHQVGRNSMDREREVPHTPLGSALGTHRGLLKTQFLPVL